MFNIEINIMSLRSAEQNDRKKKLRKIKNKIVKKFA